MERAKQMKEEKSPGFLPQIAEEENHPLSPSLVKRED